MKNPFWIGLSCYLQSESESDGVLNILTG